MIFSNGTCPIFKINKDFGTGRYMAGNQFTLWKMTKQKTKCRVCQLQNVSKDSKSKAETTERCINVKQ